MTVEEVKTIYSRQHPELATAAITGSEASGEHLRTALSVKSGPRGEFDPDHKGHSRQQERTYAFSPWNEYCPGV